MSNIVKDIPEVKQLLEFYALEYAEGSESEYGEESEEESYGEEGGEDELDEMDSQKPRAAKKSKAHPVGKTPAKGGKRKRVESGATLNSSSSDSDSDSSDSSGSSSDSASSALQTSPNTTQVSRAVSPKKKGGKKKRIASSTTSRRSSSEKPASDSEDSLKGKKLKNISNYTDSDSESKGSQHKRSVVRLGETGVKKRLDKAKESESNSDSDDSDKND